MDERTLLRRAKHSLREQLEKSFKTFHLTLRNLQMVYNNSIHVSVKGTIQLLCDIGVFDRYDNENDVLKDYLTFNKMPGGNLEPEGVGNK